VSMRRFARVRVGLLPLLAVSGGCAGGVFMVGFRCRCAKCHILKGYGILARIAACACQNQFWHNWHKRIEAL
jgi:hypothetical protein